MLQLNLASQPVLEGLNAVLDHRGTVYIPDIDKTFKISNETKLFGCQNPLKEGGNRRGLPRSFLNRFTQVKIINISYLIILLSNVQSPFILQAEVWGSRKLTFYIYALVKEVLV